MARPAIRFDRVSLNYRLFHERSASLKATLISKVKRRDTCEIFPALKNISFEVQHGEAVAVMGRNGSGKSTLLKLVADIFVPSAGRVEVDGRVAALLELGAGFHPDLTGIENIYLNGALLGLTRKQIDERLQSIIAFSELDRFIDAPIRHYSSGMYMRLGFSVAIHVEPEILLFDEMITVGDMGFQKKCYDAIMNLKRQGRTMLVVSHSPEILHMLCEKALLLDSGELMACGPFDQVLAAYAELPMPRRHAEEQAAPRIGSPLSAGE